MSEILAGDKRQFGYRDGQKAMFDHPDGVIMLSESEVLVADTYNHRLRVVDLTNGKVSTLCGSGEPGHLDGLYTNQKTKLNFP